jgi:hypothetical protein
MCFDFLHNFSLEHFSFQGKLSEKWSRNTYWSPCKVPLFLSDFNETLIFATDFGKSSIDKISWNSVQWEPSCSMRTDGRTDMTKLIVAFRNFANAPKMGQKQYCNSCSTTPSLFQSAVTLPLIYKKSALWIQNVHTKDVFHIIFTANSDYSPKQHYLRACCNSGII